MHLIHFQANFLPKIKKFKVELQIDKERWVELMTIAEIPCYFTHYPTTGREDRFNIVGHIHATWKYQLNSLNVGVDVHHFRPVEASTIPFHKTAIEKFYDQDVWVAYNPINANYRNVRGKPGSYFTDNK
jgi:hypothetical protein